MRNLIIALIASMFVIGAYAGCTQQNIITPSGKFTMCQVCCDANNNCNTICF